MAQEPPDQNLSFEQALQELEAIVQSMESGTLGLEESIAAYRRGAELVKFCQSRLAAAEEQIKVLEGDLLKPLDAAQLRGGQGGSA
ncbi:MAG: exodeoxyribonuclease VII small subunit [Sutterellaceae bacterium]|nr:exodeoxyribonuclease VII small subunit [Burkholderiaceae bacterium]MDW8430227.1 exodeoxyribonuclease VII small subunit [Sutterellaceae bacterium]